MEKKALTGLKVVGFVTAGVGPMLVKSLATHGATVIIIETAKWPNVTRVGTPFKDNIPGLNRSYSFAFVMSDRYSLAIDLKHPQAAGIIRKLIEWADVVVDNFRPGVMEKWGLGYEAVKAIKPDIIMAGFSHLGQTGPEHNAAGYGTVQAALSGLQMVTGWPDRSPTQLPGVGVLTDSIAPRYGVAAILAALHYRKKTGEGQYIDVSEFETALQFVMPALVDYTTNGNIQSRNGNRSLYAAPHGVYPCKGDDKWCAIAVFSEDEWRSFCSVIGNPKWTKRPEFATLAQRKAHEDEMDRLIAEWTVKRDPGQITSMMQKGKVEAGMVRGIGDVVEHCPQEAHRHYYWSLEHPVIGHSLYSGSSYILSKTPYKLEQAAPCLGEHNEFICTKLLNIPDEEFKTLDQAGVFN